jgi:hypothetical protein
VVAYDLVTQVKTLEIANPNHGITSLALGDFDLDGEMEIMWSGDSTGGDHEILVGDVATETIEWQHIDLRGPFFGPLLGDVDGDGVEEVISAAHESNYGGYVGGILVFEQDSLAPDIFTNGQGLGKFESLAVADIDNDQIPEIIVGGHSATKAYNFQNGVFTQAWDFSLTLSNVIFTAMDAFDVDDDGMLEILAGTERQSGSSTVGTHLVVFDYATALEESRSPELSTSNAIIKIMHGDFDGDGDLEEVCLSHDWRVYVVASDSSLEATIFGRFVSM